MTDTTLLAPADATPTRSHAAATSRRRRNQGLLRVSLVIVVVELLVAGGIRLGVGEPPERVATATAARVAPTTARALPAITPPSSWPAAVAGTVRGPVVAAVIF